MVSCSPATLLVNPWKKLFHWFLSWILLNFQVISHDISEIGRSHIIHILLRSYIIKITSLFGCKRILGVGRSSRLDVFCKNICMGVSFLMKLRPASLQLYQKRRSDKFGFLWVLRNFLKNIFYNLCWTSVEYFIILFRTSANGCFSADWKHLWFP